MNGECSLDLWTSSVIEIMVRSNICRLASSSDSGKKRRDVRICIVSYRQGRWADLILGLDSSWTEQESRDGALGRMVDKSVTTAHSSLDDDEVPIGSVSRSKIPLSTINTISLTMFDDDLAWARYLKSPPRQSSGSSLAMVT